MQSINRVTLMKVHALLAAFILPAAILFLLTGALYTWGIKGNYAVVVHELHLNQPMQDDLVELVTLAKTELIKQDKNPPSGQAKIKRIGSSFKLEWTGANMDIILEPTSQPLIAKLEIKQTSWHRQFVQLHKAKGGTPFKVYAAVFATILMLLLVTGFIMAWQMPKLRKLTLASTLLGIAAFIVVVIYS
ncbi:MAG: PepSY domain-containing protein [Proteobacteria bacterium]|nr:PepSY domain-containing protein [Pseudomonadota bacterium]